MQPSSPPPLGLPSVRPVGTQLKNTQVDDRYPMLDPGLQDWDEVLLDAVGVPLVHQAERSPSLRVDVLRKTVGKGVVTKPDTTESFSLSFISRMYFAQLPGHHTPGTELNAGLRKELKSHIIDTDSNFINLLFPPSRLPFPLDDAFFDKLSTSHTTATGLVIPAIWSMTLSSQRDIPTIYTEQSITEWLNKIGNAMAHASGHTIRRLWSQRNCNKAPDGCNIKRKPDIILIDTAYHSILDSAPGAASDWNFIQAFCEVTAQEKTSTRITDTINTKSYILFTTQHNRRFVLALSFTGRKTFRLTVTDREGQIRMSELSLSGKRHNIYFFTILAFLIFGHDSDIGLDPNVEVDSTTGRVRAIVVDNKRFEVIQLIHSVETLVGRATKVWIVSLEGQLFTIKDSWIQDKHVRSEVSFLAQMSIPELEGRVPHLVCGGDIIINGARDCTGRYRVDLEGYPYSQRVHRRIVTSSIGESLTTFQSKREFINVILSLLETHKLICDDLHILHRDISINNLLLTRSSSKELATGLLIDFDYAQLITALTSANSPSASPPTTGIFAAGKGAISADSPSASPPTTSTFAAGSSHASSTSSVIDISTTRADSSMVSKNDSKGTKGVAENLRTGTPPFMAIETLITTNQDFTQTVRHDLESFLYIILYICTFTNEAGVVLSDLQVHERAPLRSWFTKVYPSTIGFLKAGHMLRPDISVMPFITAYWEDFKPFVSEIITACFEGDPGQPNHLTHDKMIDILQRAFHTVQEPLQTGSKRSNQFVDERQLKKGKQN